MSEIAEPTEPNKCPSCGSALAKDAPAGLCPACLLKQASSGPSEINSAILPDEATADIPKDGVPPPLPGSEAAPKKSSKARKPLFTPPTPAELMIHLPGFEILELIGQGGMGAVFKARQKHLDRMVALKILPTELSGDADFAERFSREARALARLSHPNLVTVFDFGQAGPFHYICMEYIEGANLRQVLKTGQLSPRQALELVPQLCEALQYAHDEGIVHRDIKPENLLLDKKGRLKITDFGLAKLVDSEPGYTLTGSRDVMGTVHYMAPEQIEKTRDVDHRADIYSMGVVFYEMLTGELPLGRFEPPSHKIQLDIRLDEVVLRTLEKDPNRRYQNASDVQKDVARYHGPNAEPAAGAAAGQGTASGKKSSSRNEAVSIGLHGIHVKNEKEEVRIGWDGIHVNENKMGASAKVPKEPKQSSNHVAAIAMIIMGFVQFIWVGMLMLRGLFPSLFAHSGQDRAFQWAMSELPYTLIVFVGTPFIIIGGFCHLRERMKAWSTVGGLLLLAGTPFWWNQAWWIAMGTGWLGWTVFWDHYIDIDENGNPRTAVPEAPKKPRSGWKIAFIIIGILAVPVLLVLGLGALLFAPMGMKTQSISINAPVAVKPLQFQLMQTADNLHVAVVKVINAAAELTEVADATRQQLNRLENQTAQLQEEEQARYRQRPNDAPALLSKEKRERVREIQRSIDDLEKTLSASINQPQLNGALRELRILNSAYQGYLNDLCLLSDDKLEEITEAILDKSNISSFNTETTKDLKQVLEPYRLSVAQLATLLEKLPKDQAADFFKFGYERLTDPEKVAELLTLTEGHVRTVIRTELENLKTQNATAEKQAKLDRQFESLIKNGDRALSEMRLDEAQKVFSDALLLKPGDVQVMMRLKQIQDQKRSTQKTASDQVFSDLIKQGELALKSGDYLTAELTYTKALQLKPDDANVKAGLAAVRNMKKTFEEKNIGPEK